MSGGGEQERSLTALEEHQCFDKASGRSGQWLRTLDDFKWLRVTKSKSEIDSETNSEIDGEIDSRPNSGPSSGSNCETANIQNFLLIFLHENGQIKMLWAQRTLLLHNTRLGTLLQICAPTNFLEIVRNSEDECLLERQEALSKETN